MGGLGRGGIECVMTYWIPLIGNCLLNPQHTIEYSLALEQDNKMYVSCKYLSRYSRKHLIFSIHVAQVTDDGRWLILETLIEPALQTSSNMEMFSLSDPIVSNIKIGQILREEVLDSPTCNNEPYLEPSIILCVFVF